nr:tetratricopeptide repeat protein [uncultured Pseudodesulfovibrio sp.]
MNDDFFALDLASTLDDEGAPKPPSGWKYMSHGGMFRCVFSTTRPVTMGMGANRRKHSSQTFWYVEQVGREEFSGRTINDRHLPSGDPEPITMQDLVSNYTPELSYFEELVRPAMDAAQGDTDHAVAIDANGMMSLFGLSLIYLSRHEPDRARELLDQLVRIKADFDGKDQFLFNDFGIALRKSGLYPEAMAYFRRALEFVGDDENLYYNLARVHYENNDWEGCLEHLIISHRLNPKLDVTRNLLEMIVGLDQDHSLLGRYGKPTVPPHIASRARQILTADSGRLKLDEEPVVMGIQPGRARSGAVGVVELKKHGSEK